MENPTELEYLILRFQTWLWSFTKDCRVEWSQMEAKLLLTIKIPFFD